MDYVIKFRDTAFKHGVTENDIYKAIKDFIYEMPMEDNETKHLLLGFDRNANLLEIIYNRIDENTIKVFHAMPCRKAWRNLANT